MSTVSPFKQLPAPLPRCREVHLHAVAPGVWELTEIDADHRYEVAYARSRGELLILAAETAHRTGACLIVDGDCVEASA
jgi:hypothetical protein